MIVRSWFLRLFIQWEFRQRPFLPRLHQTLTEFEWRTLDRLRSALHLNFSPLQLNYCLPSLQLQLVYPILWDHPALPQRASSYRAITVSARPFWLAAPTVLPTSLHALFFRPHSWPCQFCFGDHRSRFHSALACSRSHWFPLWSTRWLVLRVLWQAQCVHSPSLQAYQIGCWLLARASSIYQLWSEWELEYR